LHGLATLEVAALAALEIDRAELLRAELKAHPAHPAIVEHQATLVALADSRADSAAGMPVAA
jgi:hypothetical protein